MDNCTPRHRGNAQAVSGARDSPRACLQNEDPKGEVKSLGTTSGVRLEGTWHAPYASSRDTRRLQQKQAATRPRNAGDAAATGSLTRQTATPPPRHAHPAWRRRCRRGFALGPRAPRGRRSNERGPILPCCLGQREVCYAERAGRRDDVKRSHLPVRKVRIKRRETNASVAHDLASIRCAR